MLMYQDFEEQLDKYARCKISENELKKYVLQFENGTEVWIKKQPEVARAAKLRQITVNQRNLEVVYITGPAGSGKTTAAKYFAEKSHFDYFVSGSGEDILDGYDKEECIILDDYRASVMRFSEFLKFIDNHTNSSIKSRYFNKDISNCKLLIITSIYEPKDLYKITAEETEESSSKEEPLEQVYRRLKHKFYIIQDNVIYRRDTNTLKTTAFMSIDTVYKHFNIDLSKKDDSSIMDQFKEDIDTIYESNRKDLIVF